MRCEEVRTYFADYINAPTELPAAALEHVTMCGSCKTEFAELCDLWEDMARAPVPLPDTGAMRARFQAAMEMENASRPVVVIPAPVKRQWFPRQWTLRVAAIAASLSIVTFLSFSVYRTMVAPQSVTIDGVARDNVGAAIPGVTVVAVNSGTGMRNSTITDANGAYTFPDLPLGTYSITADLEGFQSARYSDVAANRSAVHLPFPLQAGASSAPLELGASPGPEALQASAKEMSEKQFEDARVAMDAKSTRTETLKSPEPVATPLDRFTNDSDGLPQPAGKAGKKEEERFSESLFKMQDKKAREGQSAARSPSGASSSQNAQDLHDLFDLELDRSRNQYERAESNRFYFSNPDGVVRYSATTSQRCSWADCGGQLNIPPAIATLVPRADGESFRSADGPNRPTQPSGEAYDRIIDNPFFSPSQDPVATFSTDVDTAAYANVRRFLNQNQLPPRNAVRIEELINYFKYSYPQSVGNPITASVEAAAAPWDPQHRLVRIGLKAKEVRLDRQPTNLVFLVDVSGSMSSADKLPLLKSGLRMLVSQLTENDKVTLVTYAGSTRIALPTTNGEQKNTILQAIEGLNAEGSTNGESGIQMAYAAAVTNFVRGGVNRVILATDGDFNVGVTSTDELVRLIEEKAKSGVFLSVLGFGTGNLKDSMMEKLADRGNGHYAYIDSMDEARKVLVDNIAGTLVTVAKDVKIQVEFNPAEVTAYRLIGYENRALAAADFNNDRKDAGDMGSGHTVTALFEVVPRGVTVKGLDGEPLRFQPATEAKAPAAGNGKPAREMLNLKIRYKEPDGATSKLIEVQLIDRGQAFAAASPDFRFAAAVASFGMILRDSPYKGASNWDLVANIARDSRNQDRTGARDEFVRLVEQARQLGKR